MTDLRLSKSSRVFFLVFFLLTILSMTSAYYKYLVMKDYEIYLATDVEENVETE